MASSFVDTTRCTCGHRLGCRCHQAVSENATLIDPGTEAPHAGEAAALCSSRRGSRRRTPSLWQPALFARCQLAQKRLSAKSGKVADSGPDHGPWAVLGSGLPRTTQAPRRRRSTDNNQAPLGRNSNLPIREVAGVVEPAMPRMDRTPG